MTDTAPRWRPIAEAPRDGTRVLAIVEFSREPIVVYCMMGQWRSAWDGTPLDGEFFAAPTLWQHLPAPPEREGEG
jgi:hypothetical protein